MDKEPKLNKIPVGTGRESEPKETLPAIEVANEVIWVNPSFQELPFNISQGDSTNLAMFLTPGSQGEGVFNLKMIKEHGRSGLLGAVIFKDSDGNLYRQIDLKGCGHSITREDLHSFGKFDYSVQTIGRREKEKDALGILDRGWAEHAKDKSEEFLNEGIRTERYIAIIRLKELINERGNKISIEDAKTEKLLFKKQEPVIAVRAMGTKFRIRDIASFVFYNTEEVVAQIDKRLEDAKDLISQELGIKKEDFSWEDYLVWFYETAGRNLGLMHKNKWFHNYLTDHNITLDCRFVDLDSVKKIRIRKRKKIDQVLDKDHEDLLMSLDRLFNSLTGCESRLINLREEEKQVMFKKLIDGFNKAYTDSLGYTPRFVAEFWELGMGRVL